MNLVTWWAPSEARRRCDCDPPRILRRCWTAETQVPIWDSPALSCGAKRNFSGRWKKGRFVLAHELFQGGNLPGAEDQGQFVRESLFLSNDCLPVFFLFRLVHELDRLPVGDVPCFTIAEDPVEHSGRAEQAHVPSVQGC